MTQAVLERPMASRRPVHLWVVGIVSLLWNCVGAFDYTATELRLPFYMKNFNAEQLAYYAGLPPWEVAAWALGVWGAFAGSIGLVLAKRWAVWPFGISLVGLAVSTFYTFAIGNAPWGAGGVFFTTVIWVIAVLLFVYARRMAGRGVLQ